MEASGKQQQVGNSEVKKKEAMRNLRKQAEQKQVGNQRSKMDRAANEPDGNDQW